MQRKYFLCHMFSTNALTPDLPPCGKTRFIKHKGFRLHYWLFEGYGHFLQHVHKNAYSPFLSLTCRAYAECSPEENAKSGVSRDSSAGQLSRVIYPWYALSYGGNTRCFWILRAGWNELFWPGLCWRSWKVGNVYLKKFNLQHVWLSLLNLIKLCCKILSV